MSLVLRIANDSASVHASQAALRRFLADAGVAGRAAFRTELAFEELVTNVVRHGYPGSANASRSVDVVVVLEPASVVLTVEDDGPPFDPTLAPDDSPPESVTTARLGGLGIRFVRSVAERFEYERAGSRNRSTVWLAR